MDMKRDYYEDVRFFSSGVVAFWFCLSIVFLAAFPFLAKNYYVYVINYMAINVIVVVGLNLLVGYTGQISLGHAGFFAIGAYGTIVLMSKAHFPFLLALPCAGLAAAVFGFLLGLPALRLEGPYLAIATLGFGITATQVIGKIEMFGERQGLLAFLDLQLRNILEIPYVGQWIKILSENYFTMTGVSNIQLIIFGLILILIMLFEPLGIFGIWIRTKKYWKMWPF